MQLTTMASPISTREQLKSYLQTAIQIEHATIPPYLTALYSIKPDPAKRNTGAYNIIRAVVVEEMLHLTLAANLLNAIGGSPDLIRPDFVPDYPAYLPTGETDFVVGLEAFSRTAIETFLNIERSTPAPTRESVLTFNDVAYVKHEYLAEGRKKGRGLLPHFRPNADSGEELVLHFWSIGEFYKAIAIAFKQLAEELTEEQLFTGEAGRQVTRNYYHSSGGEIVEVKDLATALEAIDLISGQGEGSSGRIYDNDGELSHYYRFDQILRGRYYRVRIDEKDKPTGHAFKVYWDQVYAIRPNLKVGDLPPDSALRAEAIRFNEQYKGLLHRIHEALNGAPADLMSAIVDMFKIKEAALRLIHNPLPSGDGHAAPTFEINRGH